MARYRKKPVEIEAQVLTANNMREIAEWCGGFYTADLTWDYNAGAYKDPRENGHGWFLAAPYQVPGVIIPTLEGDHFASAHDFVIRGVQGEFYPCKPDIFAATYEPAD